MCLGIYAMCGSFPLNVGSVCACASECGRESIQERGVVCMYVHVNVEEIYEGVINSVCNYECDQYLSTNW